VLEEIAAMLSSRARIRSRCAPTRMARRALFAFPGISRPPSRAASFGRSRHRGRALRQHRDAGPDGLSALLRRAPRAFSSGAPGVPENPGSRGAQGQGASRGARRGLARGARDGVPRRKAGRRQGIRAPQRGKNLEGNRARALERRLLPPPAGAPRRGRDPRAPRANRLRLLARDRGESPPGERDRSQHRPRRGLLGAERRGGTEHPGVSDRRPRPGELLRAPADG
jgi:hypothetical protein